MKPVVQNAADKVQVKKAEGRVARIRLARENETRYVMNSVLGRKFIWRYLGECGVFRKSFTGNSETFFREGERNIGLKLMADVTDSCPDAYLLMQKEAMKEKELENGG